MNADEIIRALRDGTETCAECQFYGEPCGCNRPEGECDAWDIGQTAADLLETQQSRIADLEAQLARINTAFDGFDPAETLEGMRKEAVETLSQLAASQRRERAAVEDMTLIHCAGRYGCEICLNNDVCKRQHTHIGRCSDFDWRGPHEAGGG